MEGTRSF